MRKLKANELLCAQGYTYKPYFAQLRLKEFVLYEK